MVTSNLGLSGHAAIRARRRGRVRQRIRNDPPSGEARAPVGGRAEALSTGRGAGPHSRVKSGEAWNQKPKVHQGPWPGLPGDGSIRSAQRDFEM